MNKEEAQLKEFNEKWTMDKVVKNAIENAHNTPAPETIKMFAQQGKEIADINHKIDEHYLDNKLFKEEFLNYVKSDNLWKAEMTPILKAMEKQQNFFSVGGTIAKGLILIGAVGTTLVGAVHFIKEWWNN